MSDSAWVKVCRADEVRKDEAKQVVVDGTAIGLYRLDDGCYALGDVCTHAFAHLSTGFVEDETVECPLHQARFEIRTGKALDDIAPEDVQTYQVKVEDGEVFVRIGGGASEPAAEADENAELTNSLLVLLADDAGAEEWRAVLAPDAEFEGLRVHLPGSDAVAERLGSLKTGHLDWSRLGRPGYIFTGHPRAGTGDRGLVLMFGLADGTVTRVSQQPMPMPPRPATPMSMSEALRQRFDNALANDTPISLAYVDAQGRPHLSFRGSLITLSEDKLGLWVRNAESGLAEAIRTNPHVALMYRSPAERTTYQLNGRAHVAEDEETRRAIYEVMPRVEQEHDFAMLGAAVVITLDLVEGWAGIGPTGPIDPIKLVR